MILVLIVMGTLRMRTFSLLFMIERNGNVMISCFTSNLYVLYQKGVCRAEDSASPPVEVSFFVTCSIYSFFLLKSRCITRTGTMNRAAISAIMIISLFPIESNHPPPEPFS